MCQFWTKLIDIYKEHVCAPTIIVSIEAPRTFHHPPPPAIVAFNPLFHLLVTFCATKLIPSLLSTIDYLDCKNIHRHSLLHHHLGHHGHRCHPPPPTRTATTPIDVYIPTSNFLKDRILPHPQWEKLHQHEGRRNIATRRLRYYCVRRDKHHVRKTYTRTKIHKTKKIIRLTTAESNSTKIHDEKSKETTSRLAITPQWKNYHPWRKENEELSHTTPSSAIK